LSKEGVSRSPNKFGRLPSMLPWIASFSSLVCLQKYHYQLLGPSKLCFQV